MRTRPLVILAALLSLSICLHGKQKKKLVLPDYVLDAKTVAVVVDPDAPISTAHPNDNKQAADDVEQALLKWGRYRLLPDPQWADLVIVIRKGRAAGAAIGGTGNGSDRPVILQQPTNNDTRVVAQWGMPPQVSATQQQPQQRQPQPGMEAGTPEDVFVVHQGLPQPPLYGPVAWSYAGKNALNAPQVKAVEQFRDAVAAAEKARK